MTPAEPDKGHNGNVGNGREQTSNTCLQTLSEGGLGGRVGHVCDIITVWDNKRGFLWWKYNTTQSLQGNHFLVDYLTTEVFPPLYSGHYQSGKPKKRRTNLATHSIALQLIIRQGMLT